MGKTLIIISLITLFGLAGNPIFAEPPIPYPTCAIEGIVQSVEFKEAYEAACLTEEFGGCPSDTPLNDPARYAFRIRLSTVAYVAGEAKYVTCEKILPRTTEQTIVLYKDKVKAGDSFVVGQNIKGQVSSFWGVYSFSSYELVTSTTDEEVRNIELANSDPKISVYFITVIVTAGLSIALFYLLRKSKK